MNVCFSIVWLSSIVHLQWEEYPLIYRSKALNALILNFKTTKQKSTSASFKVLYHRNLEPNSIGDKSQNLGVFQKRKKNSNYRNGLIELRILNLHYRAI